MHTLQLDLGREMRGGQWQVLSLLKALNEEAILLARRGSPLLSLAAAEGLRAEAFSPWALAKWQARVDLVHAHDAKSHLWTSVLRTRNTVVSRRVAFPVKSSAASRYKYEQPEAYIAVSEFVKAQLQAGGVPAEKIHVVYDGVELPAELAHGETILAIDSADPMKGKALLLEAAAAGGFPVKLSTDLPRDLPSAAVFVYLTHSEGLGSAALLAMAAGVPVVASRVGGLPEIVEDGETGILTDNHPEEIAKAVRLALSERHRMSMKARRRIEERFTVDLMVKKTRAVYEGLLA